MPSGHGGGGGGSHGGSFGGGGSHGSFGGGGSHSSSFSNSSHSYSSCRGSSSLHFGPRIVHYGRSTVVLSSNSSSAVGAFIVLLIISIAFILFSSIGISSSKKLMEVCRQDREYYLDMIENAEQTPSLMKSALVTGVYYNENFNRYYIEYTFSTPSVSSINGSSYSVYKTKLSAPQYGQHIDLAIDSNVLSDPDSTPVDYKNFKLEDDGEYLYHLSQVTASSVTLVIGIFGTVFSIIAIVVTIQKAKKKEEEIKSTPKPETTEKAYYCQYCGSKCSPTDLKCPNCAGTIKNSK